MSEIGGTKHDGEKVRMELLPEEALEGVAKVLTFGAKKYDDHNWRKGFKYSRLIGAAKRHLASFVRDDESDLDPETGLSHIDHAICCLLFLSTHIKRGYGEDDRYKDGATAFQLDLDDVELVTLEKGPAKLEPRNAYGYPTAMSVLKDEALRKKLGIYDVKLLGDGKPPETKTVADWCAHHGVWIGDPDGWRSSFTAADGTRYRAKWFNLQRKMTEEEFLARVKRSTCRFEEPEYLTDCDPGDETDHQPEPWEDQTQ